MQRMGRVVIGMDPHKRSATIEVIDAHEKVLVQGRYGTDTDGYQEMLCAGRRFPDRVWAVEGAPGSVGTSPSVWSPTAKPSLTCRRSCPRGCGCSTPGRAARLIRSTRTASPWLGCVAPGCARSRSTTPPWRCGYWWDRRAELGRARTEIVNRIHGLLLELVLGGAKKFLTRGQASYLLRMAPAPVGIVAQTRHQLAGELIEELTVIDAKIWAADKHLRQLVTATGSSLVELNGIGSSGAARLLGDIGDIARFATAGHFASWNGTAPIEASSGDQKRHRLSRAGNRRINRVL